MKIFRIKDHFQKEFSEYVIGPNEIGNSVSYMAWGEIAPGMMKVLSPGHGHEEIILVIEGDASIESNGAVIRQGEAFYLPSDAQITLLAGADGCTYVSAGAHVEVHH